MKPSIQNPPGDVLCAGAVDIGGTKIACGVVTAAGEVLAEAAFPTAPERGVERQLKTVVEYLEELQTRLGVQLSGIGVGCTGPVDSRGVVGQVPFLPGWEGFALTEYLTARLGAPVFLENDADAALLAEARFGAGRSCPSFILVTLGTGIGGGILRDGLLYRGVGGVHPEIGHMIIHADGRVCSCGGRGCWETYCGGQGLADWVQEAYPQPAPLGAAQIFARARQGRRPYVDVVRRFCAAMGAALANLITLFAPQRIALTGGLLQSRDVFWSAVQQETQARCHLVPAHTTELVLGQLGVSAGLVGAASVFFMQQERSL